MANYTVGVDMWDTIIGEVNCLTHQMLVVDNHPAKAISFAARYLQNVTADEVNALLGANIRIVSIYENKVPPNDVEEPLPYYTPAQGLADGKEALKWAVAIGQPTQGKPPIYFTVDIDVVGKKDLTQITDYFEAVYEGLGGDKAPYHVGVYGSVYVLEAVQESGFAAYFWQAQASYGWSENNNKNPWPEANMRQTEQMIPTCSCGKQMDRNISDSGNEGSWFRAPQGYDWQRAREALKAGK